MKLFRTQVFAACPLAMLLAGSPVCIGSGPSQPEAVIVSTNAVARTNSPSPSAAIPGLSSGTETQPASAATKDSSESRPDRESSRSRRSDRRRDRSTSGSSGSNVFSTNSPIAGTDFAAFQIIPERNIFNANRSSRSAAPPKEPESKPVQIDTISLVGSMSYTKGNFAFFDGSSPSFRKVLKAGDAIEGFAIRKLDRTSVQLEVDGKTLELTVGSHLRREAGGEWKVVTAPAAGQSSDSAASDSSANAGAAGDANDILQRLMKKREQELK